MNIITPSIIQPALLLLHGYGWLAIGLGHFSGCGEREHEFFMACKLTLALWAFVVSSSCCSFCPMNYPHTPLQYRCPHIDLLSCLSSSLKGSRLIQPHRWGAGHSTWPQLSHLPGDWPAAQPHSKRTTLPPTQSIHSIIYLLFLFLAPEPAFGPPQLFEKYLVQNFKMSKMLRALVLVAAFVTATPPQITAEQLTLVMAINAGGPAHR